MCCVYKVLFKTITKDSNEEEFRHYVKCAHFLWLYHVVMVHNF